MKSRVLCCIGWLKAMCDCIHSKSNHAAVQWRQVKESHSSSVSVDEVAKLCRKVAQIAEIRRQAMMRCRSEEWRRLRAKLRWICDVVCIACIKLNVWYESMDVHSSESEMVQRSKRASNFQVPGSGVRSPALSVYCTWIWERCLHTLCVRAAPWCSNVKREMREEFTLNT